MPPVGQHLILRLNSNAPVATTHEERRVLSRAVLDKGREANLLAYGLPDTHLHVCAACSRKEAGELSRALTCSLSRRLTLKSSFSPPRFKDIDDASHLRNTFDYVLRQDEHHGVDCDPMREATNLPDLISLRICGAYTRANVHRFLPRVALEWLLHLFGLKQLGLRDDPLDKVVLATLLAAGLRDLEGSSDEVRRARRAAIEVFGDRLPPGEVARRVGTGRRNLYVVRGQTADPELVVAIRRQLYVLGLLPSAALSPLREIGSAARRHRRRRLDTAATSPTAESREVAPAAPAEVAPDTASSGITPDTASSGVTPDTAPAGPAEVAPDTASSGITPDTAPAGPAELAPDTAPAGPAEVAPDTASAPTGVAPDPASSGITSDTAPAAPAEVAADTASSTVAPDTASAGPAEVAPDTASSGVTPDTARAAPAESREGTADTAPAGVAPDTASAARTTENREGTPDPTPAARAAESREVAPDTAPGGVTPDTAPAALTAER